MVNVRDLKYVNDEKTYKYIKENFSGGGGGDITVDDSMSSTSTNPVQNKVITNALNSKADSSSIDAKDITLEQQATPETGCSATYVIKKGGEALSPKINIPEGSVIVDNNTIEKVNSIIQLKSDGVDTPHLKSHCVTTGKLADNSVTTGKLVDSCVTTDKINGSAVTTDKLNDGSVNTVKIADNSITYAKLDTNLVADNLTTDDSSKVLSARQGKVLADMIGGIEEDMLL